MKFASKYKAYARGLFTLTYALFYSFKLLHRPVLSLCAGVNLIMFVYTALLLILWFLSSLGQRLSLALGYPVVFKFSHVCGQCELCTVLKRATEEFVSPVGTHWCEGRLTSFYSPAPFQPRNSKAQDLLLHTILGQACIGSFSQSSMAKQGLQTVCFLCLYSTQDSEILIIFISVMVAFRRLS